VAGKADDILRGRAPLSLQGTAATGS